MAGRKITELEALKALAHPRRQRILDHLGRHGPATSAALARELGLNTGATSYHLRELARHGFIEEMPEKAHGRERWWRHAADTDLRFPLRSEQDAETRAVLDEFNRIAYAQDMESFVRAQEETAAEGGWGDAFPYSRGTIKVSLTELAAFFEDYIALLERYRDSDDADARTVYTRFLAFPSPGEDRNE